MNANFLTVPYRDIGDVPFEVWAREMGDYPSSPLIPLAPSLYAICKGHTALALAHMKRESSFETDRDLLSAADHNPFNLRPSYTRGIVDAVPGATGVKSDYLTFDSFASCAREWRRRVVDDPTYKGGAYKPTMTLREYVNTYAPVGDAHPTTGDANETYAADIVTMLTRFAATERELTKEPEMATKFKEHRFPGLPNPVYLPDWIIVEQKIIPSSVAGWTSGQKIPASQFTSTTFHDTGNPSTNANAEYSWARNGGRRDAPGSYNWINDGKRVIITQRFDELVGHAANHQGNVTSYAGEQTFGDGFDAAWQVGMWVHAGVLQSMGRTADTSMFQHNYWSGKNCPGQIRKRGLWSATERGVDDRIAEIKAFLVGQDAGAGGGQPPVTYPAPDRIPKLDAVSSADVVAPSYVVLDNAEKTTAYFVGDRYEAIRDTARLRYAYPKSEKIGPDIKKGESFDVDFVFQNKDGWWAYTPFGTRVDLDDLKRISDTKGAEAA